MMCLCCCGWYCRIIKEKIFKSAAKSLGGGKQLDVLVVNAYCSTAQVGGWGGSGIGGWGGEGGGQWHCGAREDMLVTEV